MAAIPYYYMLGQDSGFHGSIDEVFLTKNKNENEDDTEPLIDIYDYTGVAITTYNTTPASVNSNTQTVNTVVSMDCTLWRHLLTYNVLGFSVIKRTDPGAVGNSGSNRWGKTFSESYTNFAVADTALRSNTTGGGDTVAVKGFFLSYGYVEATIGNPTLDSAFLVDLQQLVLDLRTDYASSTTPIVFDFPPVTVAGYTGAQLTSLANVRTQIIKFCKQDVNSSYVDTSAEVRTAGGVEYTGASTMIHGKRMAEEMERLETGKGSVTGLGAPVVIMLGDDNTVGAVDQDFLVNIAEANLGASQTGTKTWNWGSNTWVTLDGTTNSNTSTDGTTDFGPDISLMADLLGAYPDGIYIFKLGRNDSSLGKPSSPGGSWLQADANLYTEVGTEWDLAKQALLDVENKIPDVIALVFMQGQEDVATQALADAYSVNLGVFVDDYRGLFQTRTDPLRNLPILVARMQDTGAYTAEYVATVRTAAEGMAVADEMVTSVDLDNFGVNTNGRTLSGDGNIEVGRKFAQDILAYNP